MKIFDYTKPKSNHLLQTYVLLIKFMHKCQWDFTFEVIGEHKDKPTKHGWDSEY